MEDGLHGASGPCVTDSVAVVSAGGAVIVVTLLPWGTGWNARDILWKVRNVMLIHAKVRTILTLSKFIFQNTDRKINQFNCTICKLLSEIINNNNQK